MATVATVHLEIMKYQDRAAVQPPLERVEAGLREREKQLEKAAERLEAENVPDIVRSKSKP
jgi:hypothetical protein